MRVSPGGRGCRGRGRERERDILIERERERERERDTDRERERDIADETMLPRSMTYEKERQRERSMSSPVRPWAHGWRGRLETAGLFSHTDCRTPDSKEQEEGGI